MIPMEAAFLVLLFAGIAAMVTGIILTRVYWRPDIAPYGRGTRVMDVTRHPERYVKNAPIALIRGLNAAGALLLAAAMLTAAFEIVQTMLRH